MHAGGLIPMLVFWLLLSFLNPVFFDSFTEVGSFMNLNPNFSKTFNQRVPTAKFESFVSVEGGY